MNTPVIGAASFRLDVGGRAGKKASWTLEQLRALPQVTRITRHVCIEGWSAIGKFTGVRPSDFLACE